MGFCAGRRRAKYPNFLYFFRKIKVIKYQSAVVCEFKMADQKNLESRREAEIL